MAQHVCPWWLAYTFDNPLRRIFHRSETMFAPYLHEGMTAVDIGCGIGYFSIGMARIVGTTGKIISVDLQEKMLKTLMVRAEKAGVADRITTVVCGENTIGINEKADFVLTFWMAHETPDEFNFFKEVHSILKKSGTLLLVEPKIHVTVTEFKNMVSMTQEIGFKLIDSPEIYFSHTAALEKQ